MLVSPDLNYLEPRYHLPSRGHSSETLIPDIHVHVHVYEEVKLAVAQLINKQQYVHISCISRHFSETLIPEVKLAVAQLINEQQYVSCIS